MIDQALSALDFSSEDLFLENFFRYLSNIIRLFFFFFLNMHQVVIEKQINHDDQVIWTFEFFFSKTRLFLEFFVPVSSRSNFKPFDVRRSIIACTTFADSLNFIY